MNIIDCHEPGTEARGYLRRVAATPANPTGRVPDTRFYCHTHAAAHDLFTARLKVAVLSRWDELGDAFMTNCGHVRPVLTADERAALAADQHPAA